MKILYIGQLADGQTCRMRMEALLEQGHEVCSLDTQKAWDESSWLSRHLQKRLFAGPVINRLNETLLQRGHEFRPDLLWCDKQEYLKPETLNTFRRLGITTVHFTPDPYFTLTWKRTRLMDACMPLFDCAITSKQYELDQYRQVCRKVIYMPLGYCEKVHRPSLPGNSDQQHEFSSDVAFLGGWEPRREALLNEVTSLDCVLKVWGYTWDHLIDGRWTPRRAYRLKTTAGKARFRIRRNAALAPTLQGGEIYGEQYAWALSGARINLGFLRHVCPDQHTTRSFEIPACGSMLLADRTAEHCEFFEEGKEAEFFSDVAELREKLCYYLEHEDQRKAIATAGRRRCEDSGYSYQVRMQHLLRQLF